MICITTLLVKGYSSTLCPISKVQYAYIKYTGAQMNVKCRVFLGKALSCFACQKTVFSEFLKKYYNLYKHINEFNFFILM